jgi:DNA-binding response OmpR family regulator
MSPNRLLVIDEQIEIAAFIAAAGLGCGYDALSTTDVESFKREYAAFRPTLVALDLSLAKDRGMALLQFLAERQCEAGVLIVSGSNQRVLDRAAAMMKKQGLKMLGTIPKPFRLGPVRALLDGLRQEPPVVQPQRARKPSTVAARRRA